MKNDINKLKNTRLQILYYMKIIWAYGFKRDIVSEINYVFFNIFKNYIQIMNLNRMM